MGPWKFTANLAAPDPEPEEEVRVSHPVEASNTLAYDQFGASAALSSDGNTLAVGAFFESSSATGINGNQADNSAVHSGAVYLY